MAAIYDKALKRKDYSGIVNKEKKEEEIHVNQEADKKDSKSMVCFFLMVSNFI